MKHEKRALSIVLALLMMLSMLTAITWPVSATSEVPADPYAKISATEDGTVLVPDDNVFFIDPSFADKAAGEEFEYTYGDGDTWGNGKTYLLKKGTNTGSTIGDIKSLSVAYNTAWASDDEMNRDLVIVVAPGDYGYVNSYNFNAAGSVADPKPEQLMNFYLLGPQAGKSPVSSSKETKEDAKEIQNDRTTSITTEAVFTNTFWTPSKCNFYLDGFAVAKAGRLYCGVGYTNHYYTNLYFADATTPAVHSVIGIGGDKFSNTLEMSDCYFNMNTVMNKSGVTSENNPLIGNKIIVDNCVFAEGKLSAVASTTYNQTHHFKFYPTLKANVSANFYGDYAETPLLQVTNSVAVDWESSHLLRFDVKSANYYGYNHNAVQINVWKNQFYDVGTYSGTSDVFYIDKVSTADQADSYTMNITDNLFSFSDEVFGNGRGNTNVFTMNKPVGSENGTNIFAKYKINIKDNIFQGPNNNYNSHVRDHDNSSVCIDLSGNLFMDNQGNILPLLIYGGSPASYNAGWNVQSDIYASDEMQGGVREMMTVREVTDGAVLYSFVQLRRRGNLSGYTYFTGNLTLLLERGKTIETKDMFTFGSKDVELVGVYSDADCQTEVTTITQDTINGKYAKAQYKTDNTTLTVVFTLNTPRNYLIVDPEGEYTENGYTFNGVTYTANAYASDGVYATFYTNLDNGVSSSAYSAFTNPNINDTLALAGQTFTDKDGAAYEYDNAMNDMILLTPGQHDFATSTEEQGMGRSVAIIGPQFNTSPYDEATAKTGKLAGGRSVNTETEAVITGTIAPSGDSSLNYVVQGCAFAGSNMAYRNNALSVHQGSMLQFHTIKNCVFANSPKSVIGTWDNSATNKVMDMIIKDCAFDFTGVDRAANDALILVRANRFKLENVAVINDNSGSIADTSHRLAYITLTDGSKVKWRAQRNYLDMKNVVLYNSNRDVALYTLRDTTTVNANYDYYSDGVEMNLENVDVVGGLGYLWGVQGGEATGSEKFVKLNVIDCDFNRPDYSGNIVAHYQTKNYEGINIYTDSSKVTDNSFIAKNGLRFNAYKANVNLDDNFFGTVVDDQVVASYISYNSGFEKNTKEYWVNQTKTVKNTDLGILNDGFKAYEQGDWLGYNQYTIDATNKSATLDMFKVNSGVTVSGVYSDADCSTAVTALTHPQVIYVVTTNGTESVVNKVDLDVVCAHDGSTTERVLQEPTCTTEGSKADFCEYCDEQIGNATVIPANQHTDGTELIVDTEPTCQTTGIGHYDCTVCDEVSTANVTIPTVACVASDTLVTDTAANCQTKGVAHSVCKWCNTPLETNIDLGYGDHIWDTEYTVTLDPTCTAVGSKEIQCSLCDTTKENSAVEIPVVEHKWEDEYTVDQEPTCKADGSKSIHCADCDAKKEGSDVVIPMGQHIWETEYTQTVDPTCTTVGKKEILCSLCDTVKENTAVEVPMLPHPWETEYTVDVDSTCTEEGAQSIYCSVCDALKENSTIPVAVKPHDWADEFTVDIEMTCYTDGEKSKHCNDCTARNEITAIPAAHGEAEWKVSVYPTYQQEGEDAYCCVICGDVLDTRVVPVLEGEDTSLIFDDISKDDWYYENDAINFVYNQGLMKGITDSTFGAEENLSRGMFVTILGRLSGVNVKVYGNDTGFADVSKTAYYAYYVSWARTEGIVKGISNTLFKPDDDITREQICKIILEYCNFEGITVEESAKAISFADASKISKWARSYVKTCQRGGLINGEKKSGKYYFRPQDTATRGEAATIIMNFCNLYMR